MPKGKRFKSDERKMVASATLDQDRKVGKKKHARKRRGGKR